MPQNAACGHQAQDHVPGMGGLKVRRRRPLNDIKRMRSKTEWHTGGFIRNIENGLTKKIRKYPEANKPLNTCTKYTVFNLTPCPPLPRFNVKPQMYFTYIVA